MSYSGTGQSAIKVFATYCSACIHRNVCMYVDEVRKHEERFKGYGTGTGCYAPITVYCTERRTDGKSEDEI